MNKRRNLAHDNLILCGIGKSWLASSLGHKACRDNRSVLYQRIPKLFADLALARGDGRYARLLRALGGALLLILDDWGLDPMPGFASIPLFPAQSPASRALATALPRDALARGLLRPSSWLQSKD